MGGGTAPGAGCKIPAATLEDSVPIRVLLLADTHLGFDFPFKPRVARRRRGDDFFTNYELALQPAMLGKVDLVVHGGDLLYRSRVPPALVEMALEPLVRIAKAGTPVYLVPGNHERSRIPLHLWGHHPNLHIFDQPRTFHHQFGDTRVALSGFPFQRRIGSIFKDFLHATKYHQTPADLHLLCLHASVEGAQVGPSDFTFRAGDDVIEGAQIPGEFSAVLAGHIHRSQLLTHSLKGDPFAAPVIYPGSIERTSFAERFEEKHYALLKFRVGDEPRLGEVSFVPLPSRPMVTLTVKGEGKTRIDLAREVENALSELDPNSVVQLRIEDPFPESMASVFRATTLRKIAPPSMNVSVRIKPRRSGSAK
jgi:exonuclease SbcD